jgi:putative endonuclease
MLYYYVYILKSLKTGRYYVGQTSNLTQRLQQHNSPEAGHTLKEQPWELAWSCTVSSRQEAMQLERKIKKRGASRFLLDMGPAMAG